MIPCVKKKRGGGITSVELNVYLKSYKGKFHSEMKLIITGILN
jgi:hypothetical protein